LRGDAVCGIKRKSGGEGKGKREALTTYFFQGRRSPARGREERALPNEEERRSFCVQKLAREKWRRRRKQQGEEVIGRGGVSLFRREQEAEFKRSARRLYFPIRGTCHYPKSR